MYKLCNQAKNFHYDHPTCGFMSVRLRTWFPFELQIAINGREWLRRSLDAAGCKYLKQGNKFLDIADYPLAQHLLDTQLDTQWKEMLAAFLPEVFPTMPQTLSRAPNLWTDDNSAATIAQRGCGYSITCASSR